MKTRTRRSIAILAGLFLGGCGVEQAFDGVPSVTDDGLQPQLEPTGTFPVKPIPTTKPTTPRNPIPPPTTTTPPTPPPITPPTDPAFYVHALGRMCMDLGNGTVGTTATLQPCNGSLSQQIGVREVTYDGCYAYHDVSLHVNGYCVGSRGGPAGGAVLELETCDADANQELALDGDSIMAGAFPQLQSLPSPPPGVLNCVRPSPPIQRQFVVSSQGNLTSAGTPLALETRALTESEYLTFAATDGSNRAPTTGFVPVTDGPSLVSALTYAGYGTVIELVTDGDDGYDLTSAVGPAGDGGAPVDTQPLSIGSGVTVRGDRKFTNDGPQITYDHDDNGQVISIDQDDVRVTGLRFQGPSPDTGVGNTLSGIVVADGHKVTIDHDEFSQFTKSAVEVDGDAPDSDDDLCPSILPGVRTPSVVVARNFIHHNEAAQEGYGLCSSAGAFPFFDGNVEYLNRHSVAADANALTGYLAQDNFVLSDSPMYEPDDHEQDFDQHATLDLHTDPVGLGAQDATGGIAGDYDQIEFNTFLGTDRHSYFLRGQPCGQGSLDNNVFLEGEWSTFNAALEVLDINGNDTETPANFSIYANTFSATDPTGSLGVGDFDGDGTDDVFVSTGTDWFYAPGGQAEWRLLQRQPDPVSNLRFADVDGDGRSDVLRVAGTEIDVSWGGVAPWQLLTLLPPTTALPVSIANLGSGTFDTLPGDDLLLADGVTWYLASGGRGFTAVGPSSKTDLRFGDFDGDGLTDVLAMVGDTPQLQISSDAHGDWSPLNGPTPSSMTGVFVGDFDGNKIADVGLQTPYPGDLFVVAFQISFGGTSAWQEGETMALPGVAASGRFDTAVPTGDLTKPTVVLTWGDDLHLYGAHGTGASQVWSRQDMR